MFRNVESQAFLGLLCGAKALVGNSSAGILEAPYLGLPFINIGARQDGREMAANVICCEGSVESVRKALARMEEPEFRAGLKADSHPFGDGYASERIFEVLSQFPLDAQLFRKRITY